MSSNGLVRKAAKPPENPDIIAFYLIVRSFVTFLGLFASYIVL
jgi:hypothetical protein